MTTETRTDPIPKKIVRLFIDQDRKRAELYSLFAGQFPELREFWGKMAVEERSQAEYLEMLIRKMDAGDVSFVESRTKTYTLRSFIDFLDGIIGKAVKKRMTVPGALSISLDIERSNIGTKVFDHFKGNSASADKFLRLLRTEGGGQGERTERLKELLKRHRETGPA